MRITKTPMMKIYLIKLIARIVIFLFILISYITRKSQLAGFFQQSIKFGISPMHILWLIFMLMMVKHLLPINKVTMALKKASKSSYEEESNYSKLELYHYVQNQNKKAWQVMLVWLFFNAIFGVLYLFGILDSVDLIMLSATYFLCDYICILFYCPFQDFIMRNKCCVNCRIYDWGHFMMFTPMLFIKNFFTWSLFFMACVVLIHWELMYISHPERFWEGSNRTLQCVNCKDKTCLIKNGLANKKAN